MLNIATGWHRITTSLIKQPLLTRGTIDMIDTDLQSGLRDLHSLRGGNFLSRQENIVLESLAG